MTIRDVRLIPLIVTLWIATIATIATGQSSITPEDIPETLPAPERMALTALMTSEHWTFQVFGLLRLERFDRGVSGPIIRRCASSSHWQVRCFAIRQAHRAGVEFSPDLYLEEEHPRVVRTALRFGIPIDRDRMIRGARRLMETPRLDELLLGLEIAQASDDDGLRDEATKRLRRLLENFDPLTAVIASRRLALLIGIHPAPTTREDWRLWAAERAGPIELAPASWARFRAAQDPPSRVSELESESLLRLRDYLGALRQQPLDVAIVMDTTSSMIPMINQTRAEVDHFIVFLSDIARRVRLAFIAYRDHDNPPIWEGIELTDDVDTVRGFLREVKITGGRDLPEAVFEGLAATLRLRWDETATKQVVLVGDARPHDDDAYKIFEVLDTLGGAGITVHSVHIDMEIPIDVGRRLTEAQRREYAEHNTRTEAAFAEIATRGGGDAAKLGAADRLVPAIMHLTLHEQWWPIFDEFYDQYLILCR